MEGAVRQYGSILAGGDAVFLSGPCLLLQTISLSVKKGTLISTKTYVTDIRSHTYEVRVQSRTIPGCTSCHRTRALAGVRASTSRSLTAQAAT